MCLPFVTIAIVDVSGRIVHVRSPYNPENTTDFLMILIILLTGSHFNDIHKKPKPKNTNVKNMRYFMVFGIEVVLL